MKLYMKQKVFSWGDKFNIYDKHEQEKYYVEGEVFTFGKKLHVFDLSGQEVLFIQEKVWSLLDRYFIFQGEKQIAEIKKEFTFFVPEYHLEPMGWEVKGEVLAHEYEILDDNKLIATISKQWFTWGDTYEIEILKDEDELLIFGTVLAVDASIEEARSRRR